MDDAAAVSPINGDDSPPSLANSTIRFSLSLYPLYILNELEVFGHQFIVFEIRRRSLNVEESFRLLELTQGISVMLRHSGTLPEFGQIVEAPEGGPSFR